MNSRRSHRAVSLKQQSIAHQLFCLRSAGPASILSSGGYFRWLRCAHPLSFATAQAQPAIQQCTLQLRLARMNEGRSGCASSFARQNLDRQRDIDRDPAHGAPYESTAPCARPHAAAGARVPTAYSSEPCSSPSLQMERTHSMRTDKATECKNRAEPPCLSRSPI